MRSRAVVLLAVVALIAVGIAKLASDRQTPPEAAEHSRQATVASSETPVAPGSFAKGACERLAPTGADRHQTVFLDAGHGGIDPGAIGVTEDGQHITEASLTLPVELDAASLLRAQGITVVVSRTGDTSVAKLGPQDISGNVLTLQGVHDDVAARDVCANDAHTSLLIGIYFDAGASPSNAGCVTGYDTARPFAAANQHLAQLVQTDVLASMNAHGWQIPNEGAMPDSGLGSLVQTTSDSPLAVGAASYGHLLLLGPAKAGYFSTPSVMPGVVVEPLFVTDPFEGSVAVSAAGQHAIAAGIATAVEQDLTRPSASAPVS